MLRKEETQIKTESTVESAILYLTDRCDGAAAEDGAGWNKIDAHIGHSFSNQIRKGKALSLKQRRVINRIIRKYKRQFPNWEDIRETLPEWVKEAEDKEEQRRQTEEQELPKLDYDSKEDRFYITTTFGQNHIAKSVPRGRWVPEPVKSWRYLNNHETLSAINHLINEEKFKVITKSARRQVLKYLSEQLEKEQGLKQVKNIKKQEETQLQLPLKTTPYEHQRKAIQIGITVDSAGLLMEQGTGKTLAAIGIATYRYLKGQVKRLLVVAPKSVLPEWARQFKEHTDLPYQAAALDMKAKRKKDILENWEDSEGIQLITINYESTWRLEEEIAKWKPDMIICDESQKIKKHSAKQSKALHRLGKIAKYRLILTGTPVSQTPLDFFSQYLFLDPTIFGTSFPKFRDRYAVMGGYGGYKVVGLKNVEELAEKAHSIAYRVTKEEAVDLPETVDKTLYAKLEPAAEKVYKEMMEESLLKLEGDDKVTAPIVLTQLMRLQQIAGGFIPADETGNIYQVSSAKLNVLKETVEDLVEAGSKMVIFANFIPEVNAISEWLTSQKVKHQVLTGKTKDRGAAIDDFQNNPKTKVFLAQISTGGVGITLTAADTAIFYSLNYKLVDYEQARARVHRIGQKKKVTYIHIAAEGTVDQEITARLREKQEIAKLVVDDLKNILNTNIKEEFQMAKNKKNLEAKLEELKTDIENSVEVNDEVVAEADKTAEAPKKEKAKKEKKEKKAKKEEKDENLVTVADLAAELGITPPVLRKKLRSSDLEKPAGRWEWPADHNDLDVIRSWSKEDIEGKKEAAAK
jgi:SNF2 family DNA or RNA helicase